MKALKISAFKEKNTDINLKGTKTYFLYFTIKTFWI